MNAEQIRRFVFGKHHGRTTLELAVDRGTAQLESCAKWTAADVDAAKLAMDKPPGEDEEPPADVIAEIQAEAQAYADGAQETTRFLLRWLNGSGKTIAGRPMAFDPSPGQRKAATFTEGHALQALLDAVLKSNKQITDSCDVVSKACDRVLQSAQAVLEVVKQQKLEPPAATVVTEDRELSEEERDVIRARAELTRAAARKVDDIVDVGIAWAGKALKLSDNDQAALALAGELVKTGAKVVADSPVEEAKAA